MQWLFAAVINVFLQILESSFKQDPRFASSGSKSDDDDFFSNNDGPNQPGNNDKQAKLQAAYQFMELKPPVTQEEVKTKYKRLSLRYHPDRNGGSQESQEQMQKLNACMDLIEKDIAGVQEGDDDDDEKHPDDAADGHSSQDKDKEDPMKAYMRMRKEMEEEMKREMERQQKMREQFETNKLQQKADCTKKSLELKLETPDGRQEANAKFTQQVLDRQQRQRQHAQTTETSAETKPEKPASSASMEDIDDHHDEAAVEKPTTDQKEATTTTKPKNDIMECNTNDVVVALRMGLPDIAINNMQVQLQAFFQEAARNMHFEGVKKTPQECRLEFLQLPLDMDKNSILHYAVYYESYQAVKALCQVALKDRMLDPVISQPNRHGQTPLFFAEIAQDESLLPLVKSLLDVSEQIKQRTQLISALKAAGNRIIAILRHIGLATTLSTALSFYISHVIFDLRIITSLVGLMMMQYLGSDLRTASEVPGMKGVVVLLTSCGMWKMTAFIIHFVLQIIMFEFVIIMTPITIAGLVSSGKKRGAIGNLLLPFTAHASVCRRVEPVFNFVHGYITPKMVTKHGWVRPYFLSLSILISFGVQQLLK
jgi:hypothetical protein